MYIGNGKKYDLLVNVEEFFSQKGNLGKHKQSECQLETDKIRFSCECGRSFTQKKGNLANHKNGMFTRNGQNTISL